MGNPYTYDDEPYKGNDIVKNLALEDLDVFIKGYIHGCTHIKDLIANIRTKFLTAALDESEDVQDRLMTYIKLLDTLEASVVARERMIHELA